MIKSLNKKYILAVDIGGTKTAVAVVDLKGAIIAREVEPTCQTGPKDGISQIIKLLENIVAKSKISNENWLGIGVGIAAVLEIRSDLIIWAPNIKGWRNIDLRGALAKYFGFPVVLEYDGHAAALGEWWVGAGKNCHTFVNVIIGTGIGGGIVLENKLFRGKNRLAGAVGWFVISNDNTKHPPSSQTNLGNWESKAAGPGIVAQTIFLMDQYPDSNLVKINDFEGLEAKNIFDEYLLKDPLAVQVLDNLAMRLGQGIANVISMINPEIVILGGGVGSNCEIILPKIKKEMQRWAQPISAKSVKLCTSKLGPDAGILGAAYGLMLQDKFAQRKEK